ncbi:MAG TPA: farnesyl diphosphate synthase [Gemmatimonadaceae bacterium]|nr:farnesyl diphosphate synthase [Gemmatimonadaceae bacterium]
MSSATAVDWTADRAAIDRALAELAERYVATLGAEVGAAVQYALLGGGKRLRGLMFLAAYRATCHDHDATNVAHAAGVAAAIEVVHAYSLVHDDLPCMDDDDMRRGRPTVHRKFGVRVATAAGVAMVPLAALATLESAQALGLSPETCAEIVGTLMRASGAGGMIGGQLLDLEGEGRASTLEQLERTHRAKTGALIHAALVVGALAAGATAEQRLALERFGDAIGLAFQIADDVLDVTGTTDQLGKPAGRDLDLQKGTYPAVLGIPGARQRASALAADGCAALRDADISSPEFEAIARFVVERES